MFQVLKVSHFLELLYKESFGGSTVVHPYNYMNGGKNFFFFFWFRGGGQKVSFNFFILKSKRCVHSSATYIK